MYKTSFKTTKSSHLRGKAPQEYPLPLENISRSQSSVPRHGRDADKSGARQDICRGLWVLCIEMPLTPRLNVMKTTAAHFSGMFSISINSRSTAALVLVSAMGSSFFLELFKACKLACFCFQFPARDAMQLWHKLPPRCGLAGLHRGPETRLPRQLEDPTNGGPSRRGLLETGRSLACGNRLPSPQSTPDHSRLVTI